MNTRERTIPWQSWFLIAAVALVAIISCAGPGRFFEKPRISIAKIRIEKMGFPDQVFRVDVRVTNPNTASFTITGVDGTMDVDGRPFARGVSTVTTQVPARGEAIVPVSLTASLSDVMAVLKKYLKEKEGVTYTIKGTLHTADSFWLPKTIPFTSQGTFSLRGNGENEGGERGGR